MKLFPENSNKYILDEVIVCDVHDMNMFKTQSMAIGQNISMFCEKLGLCAVYDSETQQDASQWEAIWHL